MTATAAWRDTARLSPGRVLAAEWIKLTTVRSTWWTSAVAAVIALLATLAIGAFSQPEGRFDAVELLLGSTLGLGFVALVVGVLGVLSIGGEHATLQIRSSYAAVPRRWPVLVAKAVVVAAWSFALGIVLTFGACALLAVVVGARGVEVVFDAGVAGGLVGGAAGLAVVAAFGVGLGALVRSSAAGITVLTAVLFVLPILVNLMVALLRVDLGDAVESHLLGAAVGDLHALPGQADLPLWAAWLTLVVWLAAVWAPALVATARRDV